MEQLSLPVELVVRILSFLSFKDIVICSGVSHQFREIINTSSILEYIIELGLCGLVDSTQGGLTTSDRLFRLREREAAWAALGWRFMWNISVRKCYKFWDLCGNLFVGTYYSDRKDVTNTPERLAVVRHYVYDFNTIDVFELEPSVQTGPTRQVSLDSVFRDFAIDPGQDLLVLLELPTKAHKFWTIRFSSFSNGLAHPKAAKPTIDISVVHQSWPYEMDPTETQILGHMVLFSQRRGPGLAGSMSVIDWTSGTHVFQLDPVLGEWCSTLLSETELLVAQRKSYRSQIALELYKLPGSSKRTAPRTEFALPFPEDSLYFKPDFCVSPASVSATGELPSRSDKLPFTYPPTPYLLAFRFECTSSLQKQLDMFLLVDQLRKYVNPGTIIPWHVWGPPTTRIFHGMLPTQWRRIIHGFRALIPQSSVVLDFNSNLWAEGDPGVVAQASHITIESAPGRSFGIVSALPYRVVRPPHLLGGHTAILSDEIVCIELVAVSRGLVNTLQVLKF